MAAGWAKLGEAVVSRRVELGYTTRHALATAAPMSERLLSDIEKARRESYDPATLARLEQALRWPAGTAVQIASGGCAPVVEKAAPAPVSVLTELAALLDPAGPLTAVERGHLASGVEHMVRLAAVSISNRQEASPH